MGLVIVTTEPGLILFLTELPEADGFADTPMMLALYGEIGRMATIVRVELAH